MALFLSTLLSPLSTEETLEDVIELLDALGFTASSWQSGSPQLRFMVMFADIYSRLTVNISNLATFGFNELAQEQVLTLLSRSHFSNERIQASAAEGKVVLTETAGDGPHEFAEGDLVFAEVDNKVTYRNTSAGTLLANSTLEVPVIAETPGLIGSVGSGKITQLITDLPGVTVNNLSDWLIKPGVDEESDLQLRERNRSKWATLGPNSPTQAYVNWALNATDADGNSANITRVKVDAQNPDGPGTLRVYVAGKTATASTEQVADAQVYVNERKPITALATVAPAVEVSVNVTGIFVAELGQGAAAKAQIETSVRDYVNGLPIGGTLIAGSGYVVFSELIAAAMGASGVKRVIMTSPTADVVLQPNEVAVVTVAFNEE